MDDDITPEVLAQYAASAARFGKSMTRLSAAVQNVHLSVVDLSADIDNQSPRMERAAEIASAALARSTRRQ